MNESDIDVEQMAKILNTRKNTGGPATVLFLGSRTGNLFRYPLLADLLKGLTNRDILNMTAIERFHECYQILESYKKQKLDDDIHAIISKALEEKHVEVVTTCVTELMKQGIFDCIITTNIGRELEDTFHQNGMVEPRDFEIIGPGSSQSLVGRITKSHPFKLVKASGDIVSQRYSICGYNIESMEFFFNTYPKLKTAVEQVKEEHMLMVGFDYKWDRHLIHAIFPRRVGSLWYINEERITETSPLFADLQTYEAKCLEYTTGGYELFFANLCSHTLGFIPTQQMTPNQPTSKEDKVLNEMRDMQHKLRNDLGYLAETVNKLHQSQEAMIKDIKEDINDLSTKVDTLLTRPLLPTLSSSTSMPSVDAISTTSQKRKQRSTRKAKQFEENGK